MLRCYTYSRQSTSCQMFGQGPLSISQAFHQIHTCFITFCKSYLTNQRSASAICIQKKYKAIRSMHLKTLGFKLRHASGPANLQGIHGHYDSDILLKSYSQNGNFRNLYFSQRLAFREFTGIDQGWPGFNGHVLVTFGHVIGMANAI